MVSAAGSDSRALSPIARIRQLNLIVLSALAPVPRSLTVLERIGQASCLVIPPLSTSLQRRIDLWLVLAAACYCIYLGLWERYVLRGRRRVMLLRSWAHPDPTGRLPGSDLRFRGRLGALALACGSHGHPRCWSPPSHLDHRQAAARGIGPG